MTAALLQADKPAVKPEDAYRLWERLKNLPGIPGGWRELPDFEKMTPEAKKRAINELLPTLAPLPKEPVVQPGPGGKPYTLTDLQHLAAQYSPALKQAVAAVDAARGNLIQARAYPNPNLILAQQPASTGLSPTLQQVSIEQVIKTDGKIKLQEAAARKDLENAELALRRAAATWPPRCAPPTSPSWPPRMPCTSIERWPS